MLFQETHVVSGIAKAIVTGVGNQTEFGKIATFGSAITEKSKLQIRIDHLISQIIKVIGILAIVVFILALIRGMAPFDIIKYVMSFIVSSVPESLPIALTIVLALGMKKLAKNKILVKSFKAMEDVGSISVIAVDKTGTLTKNRLSVTSVWSNNETDPIKTAVLTIGSNVYTNIDVADQAIYRFNNNKYPIPSNLIVYPFNTKYQLSGSYDPTNKKIYLKGSPEKIIEICSISQLDKLKVKEALKAMTTKGYRVLGLATKTVDFRPTDLSTANNFNFSGLIAFSDEIRQEVKPAISLLKQIGIRVKLITGDHKDTAFQVAQDVGITKDYNSVINNNELSSDESVFDQQANQKVVFSRILPEVKYHIIKSLNKHNITAMTGDGINDIAALAISNVGIAMGSGNDMAKDVSGMIITDNNFSTVPKAIIIGRHILNNIRKMIFYLLATSLGEDLTIIGALAFNLNLPATAIQILWINLVTDTLLVLPLGLEPSEDNTSNQPGVKSPILSRSIIIRIILVSLTMSSVILITSFYLKTIGYNDYLIRDITFNMIIASQWANAINARSNNKSIFTIKQPNHGLIFGLIIAITIQSIFTFSPISQFLDIKQASLIPIVITSLIVIVLTITIIELQKLIIRKTQQVN